MAETYLTTLTSNELGRLIDPAIDDLNGALETARRFDRAGQDSREARAVVGSAVGRLHQLVTMWLEAKARET